jgi:protein SCO1/2
VPLTVGRDFQVLAVSIDPHETAADARAARARYAARGADAARWHFLTGPPGEVGRLAAAVGFPYRYDGSADQFAHPAGLVLLSPGGRISRYLLGLDYRPLDLRLGLTEAGAGRIASPAARLLLLCYGYDPETGRYSLAVHELLRAGGLLILLAVGIPVLRMLYRDRRGRDLRGGRA